MRLVSFSGIALLLAAPVLAEPLEGLKSGADILGATTAEDWRPLDPENTLYIELQTGRVVVALSNALGRPHAERMKALAREKFYDGLSFYRVIDGFVAQGGDPFEVRKTASVGPIKAQFEEAAPPPGATFFALPDKDGFARQVGFVDSLPAGYDKKTKTAWHLHCAGAIALGRNDDKDTASTEFYVALQPQRYLDRNMTVFGRVVSGMEKLQALRRVEPPENDKDDIGERIVSIRVAADVPEKERTNLEMLRSDRPVFANFAE
ncbi:MAG: peptidylprolyl isomerase, partial [Parvularculaceae bacterium]